MHISNQTLCKIAVKASKKDKFHVTVFRWWATAANVFCASGVKVGLGYWDEQGFTSHLSDLTLSCFFSLLLHSCVSPEQVHVCLLVFFFFSMKLAAFSALRRGNTSIPNNHLRFVQKACTYQWLQHHLAKPKKMIRKARPGLAMMEDEVIHTSPECLSPCYQALQQDPVAFCVF